ncbi:peptidylprolyl isomerase [Chitinimonas viridis]|nr:peptidylprolyl isomerase [Chitinimonas viridis]
MMRQPCSTWLALMAMLIASLAVSAVSRDSLNDPGLAARVNGEPIPLAGLTVLHSIAVHSDRHTPLNKVLASVIDNRLLGEYALRHYDDATLFPGTGVAFSRAAAVEDQLVATLRRAYKTQLDLALDKAGGLDTLVKRRHVPAQAMLEQVFPPKRGLRLNSELSTAQMAAARQIVLLSYRLPGGEAGQISLADIWLKQNIQGKTQLVGGDAGYRDQQAMQLLASRYVLDWAKHASGLAPADLALLQRAIEDRDRRGALLQLLGLAADMHYSSEHLNRLIATVTPAEIRDYYYRHQQEFRRIERVRASHIHCKEEAVCQRAYAALGKGVPFGEAARRFSDAANAADGGTLGWLLPRDGAAPWLHELAFVLPPGKPSRLIREPNGSGWQIVLVEAREEGMQAPESEAVRYIASQAIGKKKALAEFKALREKLYRDADIAINPTALGFGQSALNIQEQP